MKQGFQDLKVTKQFISALGEKGIENPTEIQRKAITPLLAGQDLIGIAPTGTGKTIAYGLPLLMKVKYAQGSEPRALVLCPTKELALQVTDHIRALAVNTDLRIAGLYGGVGPKQQIAELEKGIDILVSTPGRFMDLYLKGHIPVKKLKTLVLDEADRMMDMGFFGQLRKIFEVIPSKRQNALFSATFPERVEKLAEEFLEFPTRVEAAPQGTAAETVDQRLYLLPNFKSKLFWLERLLQNEEEYKRVIVFCRTKESAGRIWKYIERKVAGGNRVIHSNKAQNSRINAVRDFAAGNFRVLVSTDLSARGLDIPEVSHVINFNVPIHTEEYVHRIGRTGRAMRTGVAITFCDPSEIYYLEKIEKVIGEEVPTWSLPDDWEDAPFLPGEEKEQAMRMDKQRQKEDPSFKGAFHEKKKASKAGKKSRRKNR